MAKKNAIDKLAQDTSKAIAAGMSYGKWKAMHPQAAARPAIPDGCMLCEYCGKPFKAKHNKRFCNDLCREASYRERERKERGGA